MAEDKDKDTRLKTERLLIQLQQLVYNSYLLAISIAGVQKAIASGNVGFSFANNYVANKEVNKLLADMANQMDYLLLNGIKREWKQGQETFWDKVKLAFSKSARDKKLFDHIRETATQSARDKTAQAFYNEKRNGFNISDRVWNLSSNAKKEIEIIIQNGIKEGKGAAEIQKSLKGYLNEPEKLFKRVRNKETGKLELSKAAQKYHPGRGVYRSSFKNAMRLARTELKAANCEAAWNSAQNNPLITGWRIVLSNNHTTLVNGVPVPFKDICDNLQGVYPKSFKFRGWHPQCRCEMLPITITKLERKNLYKSIFDGKRDEWTPQQTTEVPDNFKSWLKDNEEKIAVSNSRGTLPYFLKDNRKAWAKLSNIEVINQQTISKTIEYANEFDNKSALLANTLGAKVTPVNIKSESRIIEKAINDYMGDIAMISDIIRNTFITSANNIPRTLAVIKSNFRIIKYKSQQTSLGYSGHLFQVYIKDGIKAEIQVNTPQMIYAKQTNAKLILGDKLYKQIQKASKLPSGLGHKYYEEFRTLNAIKNLTPAQLNRIEELKNISNDYYKKIGSVIL